MTTNPIRKLLIANRGEIACRIIRTARRMGMATVAVYSDADAGALHTRMADECYALGNPIALESYLNGDAIIRAALATGADAIHPAYGFLAENAGFADAVVAAGLVFVGPPGVAIRAMGQKGVARQRMIDAGVPVLPGINEVPEDHATAAATIGFPLLIKPAAGGGGKGMKIVRGNLELDDAVAAARREALSAFGSDELVFERFLEGPRHVEVQVFADGHGNCLHLFERDCSLQRRHQKIIEEAPAPGMTDALRTRMGDAAIAAATAINYRGAGTVEFLLAADGSFYFMEMNTRLQVEHPVTEAITGLDLVEWQLRVAAGEPLPLCQADLAIKGHAMEARVYSEDPLKEFLPSTGRLRHVSLPATTAGVRVDNGVQQGDLVNAFYDPMLMKVICHGANRAEAMTRLRAALSSLQLSGTRTNRDFLCHLLDHAPFQQAPLPTDYLDRSMGKVFGHPSEASLNAAIAAVAIFLSDRASASVWHSAVNFRLNEPAIASLSVETDDTHYRVTVRKTGTLWQIETPLGQIVTHAATEGHSVSLDLDDSITVFKVVQSGADLTLFGERRTFEFKLPMEASLVTEEPGNVAAPMSGKITAVMVEAGDTISKGDPLLVLEAMKMEHTIRSPLDGTVIQVLFKSGDLVDEGTELIELEDSSL